MGRVCWPGPKHVLSPSFFFSLVKFSFPLSSIPFRLSEFSAVSRMEAAIGCVAQNIIDALSADRLRRWIRRVGLADDIKMLESKVQIVDLVYATVGKRAAGSKPLGRSLAHLEDVLYDADDLVDELDYYCLLDSSPATGSSGKSTACRSTFFL